MSPSWSPCQQPSLACLCAFWLSPATQPHFSLPFSLSSLLPLPFPCRASRCHPWPWKTNEKSTRRWRTSFQGGLFYSSGTKLGSLRCPGCVEPRRLIRILRQKSQSPFFFWFICSSWGNQHLGSKGGKQNPNLFFYKKETQ